MRRTRAEGGGQADAAKLDAGAALAAAAIAVLSLGFVVLRCSTSSEIPFLVQSSDAPWIAAQRPVAVAAQQWGREEISVTRFRRSFQVAEPRAPARLRVRALRSFRVSVNGVPRQAAASDGQRWREPLELDVSSWLREGDNEIEVAVENLIGPALLSLRLDGVEPPLVTGADWSVSFDGGPLAPAQLADDTRPYREAFAVETPAQALARGWPVVACLFASGAVLSLALQRAIPRGSAPPRGLRLLPGASLVLALLAWAELFAAKLVRLPVTVGFDVRAHLQYVDILLTRRELPPQSAESWSTFHPPLFYLICAAVLDARNALGEAPIVGRLLKGVAFAAGMGTLVATAALARRLLPDDPWARALAILFASVLPVNLYSSVYFSNESLHTLLASLALIATVDLLLVPRPRLWRWLLMGSLFGLAALTKFTVLAVIPIAFVFAAGKLWRVDREPVGRSALRLLAAALPLLAIAGWFYLRNWLRYGDPLLANWGSMPGLGHSWWQQPGFHTFAYLTHFGEALVHPYMGAGFRSFWDASYATFWGDGFIAGRVFPAGRHALWNYDYMSIGYWVALPATLLLLAGAWRGAQLAWRDPDAGRRAAFALLATTAWVLGLAYLYLALRLGFFAQAKATYLLALLTPLALWFALGFRLLDAALARHPFARAALHGWLAAFAGVLFLGFAG